MKSSNLGFHSNSTVHKNCTSQTEVDSDTIIVDVSEADKLCPVKYEMLICILLSLFIVGVAFSLLLWFSVAIS